MRTANVSVCKEMCMILHRGGSSPVMRLLHKRIVGMEFTAGGLGGAVSAPAGPGRVQGKPPEAPRFVSFLTIKIWLSLSYFCFH